MLELNKQRDGNNLGETAFKSKMKTSLYRID